MRKYGYLILLLIIVIIAAVFLTQFRLENFEAEGTSYYTVQELKSRLLTEKTDGYAVLFWLRCKYWGVPDIPFIEKIDVELVDKNTVRVCAYDKAIIGCIENMGQYMYFDREGIVVESSDTPLEGSPIVRGLKFESMVMGKKLDPKKSGLVNEILNVVMLLDRNGIDASEMRYNELYEIILDVDGSQVLLGRQDNYDFALNNLKNILQSLPGEGKYRVDMRSYSAGNAEVTARLIQ